MQWHDDGIILGLKRHGESSVIAEVMTRAHGRHLGLVRGGRSRRMQAALQPGNGVGVTWRARLDEHLGLFQLEASEFRAARLMESPLGVHGVQALATLLRLLPERDPHPDLHDRLAVLLEDIDVPGTAGALYVRFELALLDELGFGLDLSACAASGTQTDLIYVSPKTGRAVSRSAGAPYAARLLELPAFLTDETREPDSEAALAASFRLTGYFLNRHVFEPRGNAMPIARESFIRANLKRLGNVPSEG